MHVSAPKGVIKVYLVAMGDEGVLAVPGAASTPAAPYRNSLKLMRLTTRFPAGLRHPRLDGAGRRALLRPIWFRAVWQPVRPTMTAVAPPAAGGTLSYCGAPAGSARFRSWSRATGCTASWQANDGMRAWRYEQLDNITIV